MASASGGAAAFWDAKYGGSPDMRYGQEPNAWLAGPDGIQRHVRPGSRVVELASGEGRNAVWLAKAGYNIDAVDISPEGVAKARRFAESQGVTSGLNLTLGDATTFGESDAYDAVVCVFAHMPPPLKKAFFENIVRILKPGGNLVGMWYTPTHVARKDDPSVEWGVGGPPVAEACMSAGDIRSPLSAAGGAFAQLEEGDAIVDEGDLHRGKAHVVTAVWTKAELVA